mmetsp:Transcript_12751/g.42060  ORF Transcript_12751/g.42060 Transcript_12751/m.42060 type:complete len:308 (-) Transcript_12751:249-1172(-)
MTLSAVVRVLRVFSAAASRASAAIGSYRNSERTRARTSSGFSSSTNISSSSLSALLLYSSSSTSTSLFGAFLRSASAPAVFWRLLARVGCAFCAFCCFCFSACACASATKSCLRLGGLRAPPVAVAVAVDVAAAAVRGCGSGSSSRSRRSWSRRALTVWRAAMRRSSLRAAFSATAAVSASPATTFFHISRRASAASPASVPRSVLRMPRSTGPTCALASVSTDTGCAWSRLIVLRIRESPLAAIFAMFSSFARSAGAADVDSRGMRAVGTPSAFGASDFPSMSRPSFWHTRRRYSITTTAAFATRP